MEGFLLCPYLQYPSSLRREFPALAKPELELEAPFSVQIWPTADYESRGSATIFVANSTSKSIKNATKHS